MWFIKSGVQHLMYDEDVCINNSHQTGLKLSVQRVSSIIWRTILGLNLSLPGAAHMLQCMGSALVQIMDCRLFIHKIASENIICKMAAIFSKGDELITPVNILVADNAMPSEGTLWTTQIYHVFASNFCCHWFWIMFMVISLLDLICNWLLAK